MSTHAICVYCGSPSCTCFDTDQEYEEAKKELAISPAGRAELCLALLLSGEDGEAVAALQAMQQLVQAELVRRWAATASVGHAWSEAGRKESGR